MQIQPFKYYVTNLGATFKIIETKMGQFCAIGGLLYLYHLIWTVAGVNAFADYTRKIACGDDSLYAGATTAEEKGAAASAVFDTAIALVTVFHMIDWIRWLMLLTSALVGVNLMSIFYVLSLINIPFGFLAMLVGIFTRFGGDGAACAEEGKQPMRALYLGLQTICLVVYLFTCMAHVLYFKIRGVEWCHEQFIAEEEED